jgi:methionine sulfoxide reductase heme-binding subunit
MLRSRWTKAALLVVCLLPLARLAYRYYTGDLTPNPIEFITHFTGDWAIRLVVATLAITPLRKLLHVPDLIRFRRMIGLFAFFYATLHFATWFGLDKGFDMHEILGDFTKRRFIIAGLTAYLCMLPLAVTSTKGWIRRLGGRRWQLLHRLIYVTGIAVAVHYYWLVKSDIRLPLLYGSLVAILLGYRAAIWLWPRRTSAGS